MHGYRYMLNLSKGQNLFVFSPEIFKYFSEFLIILVQDFYNSNFSILKDEIDEDFVNKLLSKFDRKTNSDIKEEKNDNDDGKFETKI